VDLPDAPEDAISKTKTAVATSRIRYEAFFKLKLASLFALLPCRTEKETSGLFLLFGKQALSDLQIAFAGFVFLFLAHQSEVHFKFSAPSLFS
jgi:hypothetical protein